MLRPEVRRDFPQLVNGLAYLDSAASTLMPMSVIEAIAEAERRGTGGAEAGLYPLAEAATASYAAARETVRAFLGASSADEIIFTAGATAGCNLIAETYGRRHVGTGDDVVVTELEHHANLLPWQRLCRERGANLISIPVTAAGELDLGALSLVLTPRTKIVAVTHASNVLGSIVPVAEVATRAHRAGAVVVVDGAQAVGHLPVNVLDLGADFYVFSGHKCYGPTGIGVVYGRRELLASLPPYQVGGRMVVEVTSGGATFADPPQRFEAGTPNVSGAIGLAAALTYLASFDAASRREHERMLVAAIEDVIRELPGGRLIGAPRNRLGIVSWIVEGVHPHDLASLLGETGVAVRAGDHCAQPLVAALKLPHGTLRASLGLFNTKDDVEQLRRALAANLPKLR